MNKVVGSVNRNCFHPSALRGEVSSSLRDVELSFVEERGRSPRIKRLRLKWYKNRPTVCIHRARVYTQVHKETEGEPISLRRGKAFKRLCEEKPAVIQNDELIVGNSGCGPRYGNICPDYYCGWLSEELDTLSTRENDPYLIDEEQKREVREEIIPYWKGKSSYEYCLGHLPPETKRLSYHTGFIDSEVKQFNSLGNTHLGIPNIALRKGFKGIEETARETLSKLSYTNPENHGKISYLNAVILSCEGMKIFGERHAEEARRLAKGEENLERKKELLEIAAICDWVPYNPPRTFHEAAQMAYFVQVGSYMEESSPGMGLGRFDQYMYPYYERDIKEGRLTKEKAQEIMECLWIKTAEFVWILDLQSALYFSGYQSFLNVTVGGRKRDGTDATNELSYMCIQATDDTRLQHPSLSARIHKKSPDEFLTKCAELVRSVGTMPQMHNDDVGIPMLLGMGIPFEDAYDYDIMGCGEVQIAGKFWRYGDGGYVNMGACMEFALNDGRSRVVPSDRRWGLPTGDARKFKSYEEVEDAFNKQLAYFTEHLVITNMVTEAAHAELCPYPFVSSLFEGCVETGVDRTEGGAIYNGGPSIVSVGLSNVANSLAAIKKFVFDDKVIAMDELLDVLDKNFEGRADLQQMLLNRGPKYGTDNDYVDDIARRVADLTAKLPFKYTSMRGCRFTSALYPVAVNVPMGMVVGALPSGRKAGTPLADGVSPEQGTDRSPTEVIKTVSKFDHVRHPDGVLLNMKFSPALLAEERGVRNFVSLVRTFFDRGGWHIQFNVVSAEILREAQRHPAEYTTLIVRVSGYSAYFNDLCRETQDDIIARTEHDRW